MTIKNIFEHPLNSTKAEIRDFVLRKTWIWSTSYEYEIIINVSVGDAEEKFYISVDDIWRLKELIKEVYPQARKFCGYNIHAICYDENDNYVGVNDIAFRYLLCDGCCLHS